MLVIIIVGHGLGYRIVRVMVGQAWSVFGDGASTNAGRRVNRFSLRLEYPSGYGGRMRSWVHYQIGQVNIDLKEHIVHLDALNSRVHIVDRCSSCFYFVMFPFCSLILPSLLLLFLQVSQQFRPNACVE